MLFTLLAQAPTPSPPSWLVYVALIGVIISMLSLGFAVYALLSNRGREDTKARAEREAKEQERLKAIEAAAKDADKRISQLTEHMNERMTGFQQQHERFAERTENMFSKVADRLDETGRALQEIASLRTAMNNAVSGVERLDTLVQALNQNIINLLNHRA